MYMVARALTAAVAARRHRAGQHAVARHQPYIRGALAPLYFSPYRVTTGPAAAYNRSTAGVYRMRRALAAGVPGVFAL